jgi:thiamine-phosphate pyrophosphorylase
VQLYAITDRLLFAGREALLQCVALWAANHVEYIQIREKDLDAAEQETLAREIVQTARKAGTHTRVLLNGPAEIAAATGCDGVHLPSGMPAEAIAKAHGVMRLGLQQPIISVSCHTLADIEQARNAGASMALFAPVFEKQLQREKKTGQGLSALAAACRAAAPMPVFALGGVNANNAQSCVDAGALGVAAIRLFASSPWRDIR